MKLRIVQSALLLFILINSATTSFLQVRRSPPPDMGFEIVLPDNSRPLLRLGVSNGGRSMTLIRREQLKIKDPKAAGNFTAVDVWADGEAGAVRVRLSIIYNDLSDQEWWKNKKEKIVGSFLVRGGEAVRPSELAQFGIEPFEMRAASAGVVAFAPGEGPRIINNTRSLKVVRLERALDNYVLWLQNISSKNIMAYSLAFGSGGMDVLGVSYGDKRPVVMAGDAAREERLSDQNIESVGITIRALVFEDGSFEGDPTFAAHFLARGEGIRTQAPHVLELINEALSVDDAGLQTSFDKLEARLRAMPEAMDKQSALELLKSKFSSLDEETLSMLYEKMKDGFYEARNIALSSIGNARRAIETEERRRAGTDQKLRAKRLREMLIRLKENFEKIGEV